MFKISNLLSLLRMVLAIPFVYVVWYEHTYWALTLAVLAIISDVLDGYLARKLNQMSELGKILDPLADKIFVGAGALVLVIQEKIPIWFAIAVVLRDLLIIAGGIYAKSKMDFVIPSNYTGKITVSIIALVLISIFLGNQLMYDYGLKLALIAMITSLMVYAVGMINELKKNKAKSNK